MRSLRDETIKVYRPRLEVIRNAPIKPYYQKSWFDVLSEKTIPKGIGYFWCATSLVSLLLNYYLVTVYL